MKEILFLKFLWINQFQILKQEEFLKNVTSSVKDGSSNNLKTIDINIEEMPTGEISAGADGTNGGTFAFKVSENNWLGKGAD